MAPPELGARRSPARSAGVPQCRQVELVGVFCAWLLLNDPDLRILVLAAEHDLARKMVRNVKRIIERHPLTGGLVPRRGDQWTADQFTVRRALTQRDPSLLARDQRQHHRLAR